MIIAPLTLRCSCGSDEWIACAPGSVEQTTADDPSVPLLHPLPAVPMQCWCVAHWPFAAVSRRAA